ncbi:MAG: hypothetical protein IPI19_17815 [Ignavibacteriales bacterium]|nr:hypothetical protein [Ignavibacteriales bacterium]
MASLVPYIWGIVFGFVYLLAVFFFLLSRLKIYSLKPSVDIEKYAPYLAVIVIFASSIFGFVAQTLTGYVIGLLNPQVAYKPTNSFSGQSEIGGLYASLILMRHLCFATFLLSITLFKWIRKDHQGCPFSLFYFSIFFHPNFIVKISNKKLFHWIPLIMQY